MELYLLSPLAQFPGVEVHLEGTETDKFGEIGGHGNSHVPQSSTFRAQFRRVTALSEVLRTMCS